MNELQNFNFKNSQLQTIVIDDKPWFVGTQVAETLGYSNPSKAINDHVKSHQKQTLRYKAYNESLEALWTGRDYSDKVLISEGGLNRLVMRSGLGAAEEFQDWVTDEVLPTIRKNGAYMTNEKAQDILHGNGLADLLIQAGEQIKTLELDKQQLQVELEEVREKTTYLDLILESPNDILITQIAQDYGMSAVSFNRVLHNLRIQRKVNKQWVLYSKYMGKGYIGSRTRNFLDSTGTERTSITTTWKQKGRKFLYETLKKNGYLPIVEQDDLAS